MAALGLKSARAMCADLLRAKDRSAFLLSQYFPDGSARDAFVGLRAFNLETAKAVDAASDRRIAQIKLEYFKAAVQKIHSDAVESEPATVLLQAAVQAGSPVAKKYLLTMVQTRQAQLALRPYKTVEDMERFGEGVFSQMNYATLDVLNAADPDTAAHFAAHPQLDELSTQIAAHVGQAAGVAALLRAFDFYLKKHHFVTLPAQLLAEHHISQQQILDAFEAGPKDAQAAALVPGLADVVFTTATKANDHILTARSLLDQFREEAGAIPPSLILTAMTALPISLYLERLEKVDFAIERATGSEWKLPYRSWKAWRQRQI